MISFLFGFNAWVPQLTGFVNAMERILGDP
jgi:hypothetical protein